MNKPPQDVLLHHLRGAILAEVRADEDITLRQLAVVLAVYLSDEPQTVGSLAEHLDVGKPAITRALDRLSGLDLVQRTANPADGRSVLAQRTPAGSVMMERLKASMAETTQLLGRLRSPP